MDQVIDHATVLALQADVRRDHAIAGWVVQRNQPKPGMFTARLVATMPTSYVLTADTLVKIHGQLPPGPVRSDRQPAEPLDLVEI